MKSVKNKLKFEIITRIHLGTDAVQAPPRLPSMSISNDVLAAVDTPKIVAALCLQIINKNQTNLRIINRRR